MDHILSFVNLNIAYSCMLNLSIGIFDHRYIWPSTQQFLMLPWSFVEWPKTSKYIKLMMLYFTSPWWNIQIAFIVTDWSSYLIWNCTLTALVTIKTWTNCQKYAKLSEITILLSQSRIDWCNFCNHKAGLFIEKMKYVSSALISSSWSQENFITSIKTL